MRSWLVLLLLLAGSGCGGGGSPATCQVSCAEPSTSVPDAGAANFMQNIPKQRALSQFLLTIASALPAFVQDAETAAISTSSPTLGVGCAAATDGAATCSVAAVQRLPPIQLDGGQTGSATVREISSGGIITIALGNGTGSMFTDGLNLLSVSLTGPATWNVIGTGAFAFSARFSGSASFANSGLSALTLSASDPITSATGVLAFGATSQFVVGNLTQTGSSATDALISVSTSGTGTITYGTGTVASITDWVIQT
jgi:hypothetical protein